MTLWFRKHYVDAILRGDKRATIRPAGSRVPAEGATVTLHVGPRPKFADAIVVSVERFTLDDCERWWRIDGHDSADEMRAELTETYGDDTGLVAITFRLVGRRRRTRRRERNVTT